MFKRINKISITLLLALSLVACSNEPQYKLHLLNEDPVTVELGSDLDLSLDKYIDVSNLSEEELAEISIKLVTPMMDTNGNVKADSKEVDPTNLDFGTKAILIELDGEQKTINVKVEDTVAPEFAKSKDSYTIEEGDKLPDIKKDFEANDLSDVSISINTDEVDTDKAGEYKATVSATDTSGNESTKEVTITVKEKPEPEISTPSYSGGSTTTSRPSGGGSSSSKPSSGSSGSSSKPSGGSSGSSSSGSSGGSSSKPAEETCTPYYGGFKGLRFPTADAADAWMDNYIWTDENLNGPGYMGWGTSYDSCGWWYISDVR